MIEIWVWAWVVIWCACAVHEAGHVVVARRVGATITRVVVGMPTILRFRIMGVPAEFGPIPVAGYVGLDNLASHRCAVATMLGGPVASLLSAIPAGVLVLVYPIGTGVGLVSRMWVATALLAGVLQLIPIPPLDGGMALMHWLQGRGVRLDEGAVRRVGWCVLAALHGAVVPGHEFLAGALMASVAAWVVYRRRT